MVWAIVGLLVLATQATALEFFGYVAVACGHDDPLDDSTRTDYSDEVAGFTNVNHVCLPADPLQWAGTLARTAAQYDPLLSVEGLFDFGPAGSGPDGDLAQGLWRTFTEALTESRVSPGQVIFYLADEPTLRGIPADQIARAGQIVHATYPDARTMLVEAYRAGGPGPIPDSVDLWGFDAYALRDPGAEPLYVAYLDAARALLQPRQRIVLVLDAQHTPTHAEAGLSETDMADVARATYAFARTRPEVAGMIGYLWAGGVDHAKEKGVRDLPDDVRAAHEEIGRSIVTGATNASP